MKIGKKRNLYKVTPKILIMNLLLICLFTNTAYIQAVKQENITIISGSEKLLETDGVQSIDFQAEYKSPAETINAANNKEFTLYVCKSKHLNKDNQGCKDGSWCYSPDPSVNNPLSCEYSLSPEAETSGQYFMFVCNQSAECSSFFSSYFATQENLLELSVPTTVNLSPSLFSFQGQNNANNPLGDIKITAIANNHFEWKVDIAAEDWTSEKEALMDYDGDGSSTGQLTINLDKATLESTDMVRGIKLGETASFSQKIKNINIITANKNNENGIFTIKNIQLNQFVPGNQAEGKYKTLLTFTIS